MRIGLVWPACQRRRWPKYDWAKSALARLGHHVFDVGSVDQLVEADRACELVLFAHKNAGLNKASVMQLAVKRKSVWAQWWFDLVATDPSKPLKSQSLFRSFGGLMGSMDFVFVKEMAMLDEYKQNGVNAYWLDQACPSDMPAMEHKESPKWDAIFWGTPGDQYRRNDMASLVKAGFKVAWAGHAGDGMPKNVERLDWVHPFDLPTISSDARAVLVVDRRPDIVGYRSDRCWLAAGMGACVVKRMYPKERTRMVLYEESPVRAIQEIAKESVHERAERGRATREWVMNAHTYEDRCRELISVCGFWQQAIAV